MILPAHICSYIRTNANFSIRKVIHTGKEVCPQVSEKSQLHYWKVEGWKDQLKQSSVQPVPGSTEELLS